MGNDLSQTSASDTKNRRNPEYQSEHLQRPTTVNQPNAQEPRNTYLAGPSRAQAGTAASGGVRASQSDHVNNHSLAPEQRQQSQAGIAASARVRGFQSVATNNHPLAPEERQQNQAGTAVSGGIKGIQSGSANNHLLTPEQSQQSQSGTAVSSGIRGFQPGSVHSHSLTPEQRPQSQAGTAVSGGTRGFQSGSANNHSLTPEQRLQSQTGTAVSGGIRGFQPGSIHSHSLTPEQRQQSQAVTTVSGGIKEIQSGSANNHSLTQEQRQKSQAGTAVSDGLRGSKSGSANNHYLTPEQEQQSCGVTSSSRGVRGLLPGSVHNHTVTPEQSQESLAGNTYKVPGGGGFQSGFVKNQTVSQAQRQESQAGNTNKVPGGGGVQSGSVYNPTVFPEQRQESQAGNTNKVPGGGGVQSGSVNKELEQLLEQVGIAANRPFQPLSLNNQPLVPEQRNPFMNSNDNTPGSSFNNQPPRRAPERFMDNQPLVPEQRPPIGSNPFVNNSDNSPGSSSNNTPPWRAPTRFEDLFDGHSDRKVNPGLQREVQKKSRSSSPFGKLVECPVCARQVPITEISYHIQEHTAGDTEANEEPLQMVQVNVECPTKKIFSRCNWTGSFLCEDDMKRELENHIRVKHKAHCLNNAGKEMEIASIDTEDRLLYFNHIEGTMFFTHLKLNKTENVLYCSTQVIGNDDEASYWGYSFDFYKKNEKHRKFRYEDVCDSNDEPFEEGSCAKIPLDYLKTFVNEGVVRYKFFFDKLTRDQKRASRFRKNFKKRPGNNFGQNFHRRPGNNNYGQKH